MKAILRLMMAYRIALIGYCVSLVLVFGWALLPGPGEMIWGDDIHRQYYFYRQFFNSFLKEGIWPWWNPYYFSGAPFIANSQINIWYPPTWLFFFLPLNIAYSWHITLHILWAMLGMYTLMSSRDPAGRGAAIPRGLLRRFAPRNDAFIGPWLAGLVFGLSGFFTARIWAGHVDVIAAASWMPWVVWAFTSRSIVFAAIVFAMQLLAGYQTMAFFTLIAVFIFVKSFKDFLRMALTVLLGVGIAGIQIIPLQEFFRAGIRTFDFPYSWNSYGSLTIESLKQFFNPFVFGDQITYHGPPPNYPEHAFFVGRVSLFVIAFGVLTSLALALKRCKSDMRPHTVYTPLFFTVVTVFGLWVSLGPNAPIDLQYLLWKIVPTYKYLRLPPRHLILVVFGLSALIAYSLSFAKLSLAKLIAVLIVFEMILYARHFIALKPIPEARHDAALINLLSPPRCRTSFTSGVVSEDCLFRTLTNFGAWIPPRDSFDFDAGMSYRVFNATGYDPSILRSYYEFIDIANGNAPGSSILSHDVQIPYLNVFSPATDFLNIKYLLVPRAYDPLGGNPSGQAALRFRLIREDIARDYRLYENKTVKPRFYFEKGSVSVTRYTPNEIVLVTDTDRGETLMSSEVFYPGWEAFIDGKKADIIKTNHAFRALFVPAGRHTVSYRYNPRIFVIGGVISGVSVVLCFFIWKKSAVS